MFVTRIFIGYDFENLQHYKKNVITLRLCNSDIVHLYHIGHSVFKFLCPGSNDRGHMVFVLSVCLSVCCQLQPSL